MKQKHCKLCDETKSLSEFHSTGYTTHKDGSRTKVVKPTCKLCANATLKQRFIEKLAACGIQWKCEHCGYDRCIAALDVHHNDPTEKDFILASAWTRSLEQIRKELAKCSILCANCHREHHAGLW